MYNLPREVSFGLDDPPAKAKDYEVYRGGYAQYATELVVPKLVRQSRFAAATPEEADLFLVPFQGVSAIHCAQRLPSMLTRRIHQEAGN